MTRSRQVHRFLCDVLEEMRMADKGRNYSYLRALIEEVQVLGNRMEAGLSEKEDVEYYHKEADKAEEESKIAKEKLKKLEDKIKELEKIAD